MSDKSSQSHSAQGSRNGTGVRTVDVDTVKESVASVSPFDGSPPYTVEGTLETNLLRNPNVLAYLRRETTAKPTAEEWLETIVDVDGQAALTFYESETPTEPRRHYIVGRDDDEWIAAWREWGKSFSKAYHTRPGPGTIRAWVKSSSGVSICHRTDVPNTVAHLFASANKVESQLNKYKPDSCTSCNRTMYDGAAPDSSETDFRFDRERSSDTEIIWECTTCHAILLASDSNTLSN